MSASLVGSEMCIRDSSRALLAVNMRARAPEDLGRRTNPSSHEKGGGELIGSAWWVGHLALASFALASGAARYPKPRPNTWLVS
eukprot:1415665-Alexandrium_andersonii.AAC.1